MIQGHGGNIYAMARRLGCRPAEIIDMSSNINPLGMPPGLLTYLKDHMDRIGALPEVDGRSAAWFMAALLGVDASRILAGNGTTQFIYTACSALKCEKVLIVGPTYADYADACRMYQIEHHYFLADEKDRFKIDIERLDQSIHGFDTVFICNPNNPTGHLIPDAALAGLFRAHPKVRFMIDESYLPFVTAKDYKSMTNCELDNVGVLWSISKIFGVPGLRAGFLIAGEAIRSSFNCFMQPWSLNSLAQAAVAFLGHNRAVVSEYIEKTKYYLENERRRFHDGLRSWAKSTSYPSETSYILIGLPLGVAAEAVCAKMGQRRILIRDCSNFHGLSHRFIRVALKDPEVNQMAVNYLAEIS